MGLRERFDGFADSVASVVASLFVTAPDHPDRGGLTGSEGDRQGENDGPVVDPSDPDRNRE